MKYVDFSLCYKPYQNLIDKIWGEKTDNGIMWEAFQRGNSEFFNGITFNTERACVSLPSTPTGQNKTFHFINGANLIQILSFQSFYSWYKLVISAVLICTKV